MIVSLQVKSFFNSLKVTFFALELDQQGQSKFSLDIFGEILAGDIK